MDQVLKTILSKLEHIEGRLNHVEHEEKTETPLFEKAIKVMAKYDELTAQTLEKELGVSRQEGDRLLDLLESAGLGKCSMEEV